jgi:hypothetical protein
MYGSMYAPVHGSLAHVHASDSDVQYKYSRSWDAPALAVASTIYAACLGCATRAISAKLAAPARVALLSHTEAHAAIAHMPRLAVCVHVTLWSAACFTLVALSASPAVEARARAVALAPAKIFKTNVQLK